MTENQTRPTTVRYLVLLGLCLIAALAYTHRLSLGSAEKKLRTEVGLTQDDTKIALSLFFWTYGIFQIPTGLLVDAWGPRRALFLFGMMCALTVALSAATPLFGAAIGVWMLWASRSLMGIAQAGLFPASTRCLASWFPVSRRASAAGTLQAAMSIGAAAGAPILGFLLFYVRLELVFIIIAIPGIIWSLWFFWWFRDRPEQHPSVNPAEVALLTKDRSASPPPAKGPTPWLELMTSGKLVWICGAQFFRAGANVFWLTWGMTFLKDSYHLGEREAGWVGGILLSGIMLGSFGGGILADYVLARTGSKRWSRAGVAIITSLIGVALFITWQMIELNMYFSIGLLFLAIVFTNCGNPCAYSVSLDTGGRYMAVAFATMNMMGNFGAACFPLIAGDWIKEYGNQSVVWLIAGAYTIGAICWCFVNPNGTIIDESQGYRSREEELRERKRLRKKQAQERRAEKEQRAKSRSQRRKDR